MTEPPPAPNQTSSIADPEMDEMMKTLKEMDIEINFRDPIAVRLAKEMLEERKNDEAKRVARVSSLSKAFGPVQKMKYINGKSAKKDETYFNLAPDVNSSPASSLITANSTLFAIPWQGGGGPFYVSSLKSVGKAEPSQAYTANGHKSHVNDLQFHPFDESLLVSGGDDSRLLLWKFDGELSRNLVESDACANLKGHSRAIRTVEFNPVANNVLLSSSMDGVVKLWDVQSSKEMYSMGDQTLHTDLIVNSSFSFDGSKFATSCKDKHVRIFDPRMGPTSGPLTDIVPHDGSKPTRCTWVSSKGIDYMITAGFDRNAKRQLHLYDIRGSIDRPRCSLDIDNGGGVMYLTVDQDTGLLIIAGKGDSTYKCYDLGNIADKPEISACSEITLESPICGLAALPKRSCDVKNVEIMRILHLTQTAVEPVSIFIPKSPQLKTFFQDDLFPDTREYLKPGVSSAEAWFNGDKSQPPLASLKPEGMVSLSDKPKETARPQSTQVFRSKINAEEMAKKQREAHMDRLANLATQHGEYNKNQSMGGGDSDSDDNWSD